MVNLKAKPYCLDDEQIKWVNDTIASMSDEEKVGQLFFQLTAGIDEEYLKTLVQKYHVGGCRYNNMPGQVVKMQNATLQKHAKVPVFIACNTETGGNGACFDGTNIASCIKIAATDNDDYAKALGKYSNEEAVSIGCNMAFAPICDIHYNWQNTEVVTRAFGNDHNRVARMALAYMQGAHEAGVACAAKHFPGNGQDFRDAHISNNLNEFGYDKWMETYGHVYKTLIDNGLDAIMGGHIMMREYMREINPDIKDDDLLPATLCPEIMTGLLRDKLGFNGMVVTDASHMVGMTDRMTRKQMLPTAINAGCDMFLFFNDPDEDFATMLNAYQTGVISQERMTEALTRILGLKAHMGMHKGVTIDMTAPVVLGKEETKKVVSAISHDAVTLVKYKDQGVLPLTPAKYKRIMIVHVKGAPGPMDDIIKMVMGGGNKKNPAEDLRDRLIEKVRALETPCDKCKAIVDEYLNTLEDGAANEKATKALIELLEGWAADGCEASKEILAEKNFLNKKSMWIFGGDGWAYDIGFGGLDHVLASGEDVNVMVFDTEVYSNTGGQASKASNIGQVAQFAAAGKAIGKKNLAEIAMSYGYVYVAQVAMGADMNQTLKAICEAEAYPGPSIIIGYAPCEMHGVKGGMTNCQAEMKKAVEAGYWNTFRFNPALKAEGKNPFSLDSKAPTGDYKSFITGETRYSRLQQQFPERAEELFDKAEAAAKAKYERLVKMVDLYATEE